VVSEITIVSSRSELATDVVKIPTDDLWTEFLKLQISDATKETYAAAIADFFHFANPEFEIDLAIGWFLKLRQEEAIWVALKYKAQLQVDDFAPSTINVRLSAMKSLVNYARKLGQCGFNLVDVKGVKAQTYRDTSGVSPEVFKLIIDTLDRATVAGKRDYAILRLLWDNALRRFEVAGVSIGDYREGKLWIKGKGQMQRESVDLSVRSIGAIEDWLGVRGSINVLDPLFVALDHKCFGMRLSGRSIDRILKRTAQKAQATTKILSPHRIRHSSITAVLDATNGDVRRVRKFSRHKKVETVIIYDENRLRDQGDLTDLISDLV
jgi:integrase/recombinase XerC